ncbi:heme peroxidase-domain-containing protein [Cladorrhinum sp. PSN332]|nr:heme peroxidase-domain-containing protein [Cladorrhinum sp. PSN332]
MSLHSHRSLLNGSSNGHANGNGNGTTHRNKTQDELDDWDKQLARHVKSQSTAFHGDALIGNQLIPKTGILDDARRIFTVKNIPGITNVMSKFIKGAGLDVKAGAQLIGSMSNNSEARAKFIESQVKTKYDRMLHPPLTYLGDAFKYRTADGKFNSALNPHLGQSGAPYAKTVPSKTHPLGALPDPGDLFDKLMARDENGRASASGLSSMLIYHATIIIHDIFRTNDGDKNISDSSSYLDLSPLYGFAEEMQRKVRDGKYKLGLLKPDTFAEDRLLRQPPGVCIYLVMYNRYHNYAATQLLRINENGRFSIPLRDAYNVFVDNGREPLPHYSKAVEALEAYFYKDMEDEKALKKRAEDVKKFYADWEAAWNKLDDDLFNIARLITCGLYIQISIHDYLRALMGFHNYDSNFTLDPRVHETAAKEVSRGMGNQVAVEFNLLYRFHCAISMKDEGYAEDSMRELFKKDKYWNPKDLNLRQFISLMGTSKAYGSIQAPTPVWEQEFGLKHDEKRSFKRDKITGLFDDQQMVSQLLESMDDPISNFGPKNVPQCLKAVEIMGILQARKWGVGTLNDFREFFGMKRHTSFESISGNPAVQSALCDLYEHPDKVELYPGIFCESDSGMNADPGPSDVDSALWAAIFSDAITLVRSDRFYTVDWNIHSLTSWGMKEVTPDNDVLKSSVFHRLLQRSFPEWFPADSIRFFHPFYTAQKNAQLAQEQGYASGFRMSLKSAEVTKRGLFGPKEAKYTFDVERSEPRRPSKPVYLGDPLKIKALLEDRSDILVHPARLYTADLPLKVAEVLAPGQHASKQEKPIEQDATALTAYFTELMRGIIQRESIVINSDLKKPVYSVDITRDFAIPVVTRYVADFLGFGHLVKSETNLSAMHSENDIYQHITNCQVYLSYNADETKLLKRRLAFKKSMNFLHDLTLKEGTIVEAKKSLMTRKLSSFGRWLFTGHKGTANPMRQLGLEVAERILANEPDPGRAAAIFLLVGLDSAYNSVLGFTSVLDLFLEDLYKLASELRDPKTKTRDTCDWLDVQKLALADVGSKEDDLLRKVVLNAQRVSVKLPIIRKATKKHDAVDGKTTLLTVDKGQTVICDINRAARDAAKQGLNLRESSTAGDIWETEYLAYRSSFTEQFGSYHPKQVAALSLVTMIKVLAQLKNLRRGHDSQGRVKRIPLDSSNDVEGEV